MPDQAKAKGLVGCLRVLDAVPPDDQLPPELKGLGQGRKSQEQALLEGTADPGGTETTEPPTRDPELGPSLNLSLRKDPSPNAFPNYCLDYHGPEPWLPQGRFRNCTVGFYEYTTYEVSTGKPLGVGEFYEIKWAELAALGQDWWMYVKLNMYSANGIVTTGTYALMQPWCSSDIGNCQVLNADPLNGFAEMQPGVGMMEAYHFAEARDFVNGSPSVIRSSTDLWVGNLNNPGLAAGPVTDVEMHRIRCDHMSWIFPTSSRGGCVFQAFPPSFTLSTFDPAVDESAVHIRYSQQILPDGYGVVGRQPLNRLSPATYDWLIGLNRDWACRNMPSPRPAGLSCDEYAFASTRQGAFLAGDGHYHAALINATDNSTAGSRLGAFFNANRVIDGDAFYVVIF